MAGFARNERDGSVTVEAEGRPPPSRMEAWCRTGPSRAEVTSVEVVDVDPLGTAYFEDR